MRNKKSPTVENISVRGKRIYSIGFIFRGTKSRFFFQLVCTHRRKHVTGDKLREPNLRSIFLLGVLGTETKRVRFVCIYIYVHINLEHVPSKQFTRAHSLEPVVKIVSHGALLVKLCFDDETRVFGITSRKIEIQSDKKSSCYRARIPLSYFNG